MTIDAEKPRPTPTPTASTAEADLAFLRGIVEGGGRGQMTMGVCFLAGGLLYGIQCLFHLGQIAGIVRWPGLASLAFVVLITAGVLGCIAWAVLRDRRINGGGRSAPTMSRAMNGAFSGAGMANLAVIIVFGVGAMREHDFSLWLYYAAIVFAFQSVAWFMAWTLKRKLWMGLAALGHWITAVALGLLVREPVAYLWVCTAALFLLFALPGWIMVREARAAQKAA
ncbi:hypothetical protein BH09PSE1_BH09PSE1_18330 [soil metagenome]